MTYQLIIRPEAELDIEDAFEWYGDKLESLGTEFVIAVDAAFSKNSFIPRISIAIALTKSS